jgi:hypothetical protein
MTCAPQSASRQQEDLDVDHSVRHRVAIVATSVLVLAGLSMYLPPDKTGDCSDIMLTTAAACRIRIARGALFMLLYQT